MTEEQQTWTPSEAMADALSLHPECQHAEFTNGLSACFRPTYVVQLWRNAECYAANDPARHTVEGYAVNREG